MGVNLIALQPTLKTTSQVLRCGAAAANFFGAHTLRICASMCYWAGNLKPTRAAAHLSAAVQNPHSVKFEFEKRETTAAVTRYTVLTFGVDNSTSVVFEIKIGSRATLPPLGGMNRRASDFGNGYATTSPRKRAGGRTNTAALFR